jgi:hypothetical protein
MGTEKFRDRVGGSTDSPGEPLTALGRWYATVLSWRPRQLALFVHDPTLLPVLMPLAPAATVLARFPGRLAEILELHDVPRAVIVREIGALTPGCVTSTASRSIVGVMNELTHLAGVWRNPTGTTDDGIVLVGDDDLDELAAYVAAEANHEDDRRRQRPSVSSSNAVTTAPSGSSAWTWRNRHHGSNASDLLPPPAPKQSRRRWSSPASSAVCSATRSSSGVRSSSTSAAMTEQSA